MDINVKVDNYRCFSKGKPACLTIRGGFSAFVGVNNCGKSSLLKSFYELRGLFSPLRDIGQIAQLFSGARPTFPAPLEIADRDEMFCNRNRENLQIEVTLGVPTQADLISRAVIDLDRNTAQFSARFYSGSGDEVSVRTWRPNLWGSVKWSEDDTLKGEAAGNPTVARFGPIRYAFETLSDTYYVPAFRHLSPFAPASGVNPSYYDINVGRPFIDSWHAMQTGPSKQGREQIFRLVDEIRENFGFKQLQIHASQNGTSLQLLIDGQPFQLQEIGAGIAQFIVVLGNAAFRRPSLILIDEPEINLHPSLQLKFLTKLATYASKAVLFATHNIGLARSVAEDIYSVSVSDNGTEIREINETPRLAELLGELNYEGYRPLGFEKVLLVEGRTSVKTFIELLRHYNKEHQVLIVPMSDLINRYSREELQEATRICPHTYAVIDNEKENAADSIQEGRQQFAENCRALGIDCLIQERRAIENYFSDRAIKQVEGKTYRALGLFEGRRGLRLWPKTENWKIARAMDRAELDHTDLGQFLMRI